MDWITKFFGAVKNLHDVPWADIGNFLRVLFVRRPLALLLILICLGAFIFCSAQYYWRSTLFETIVSNTLQANTEPTAQKYKGLEAFILSNVAQDVGADLKGRRFSQKFRDQFLELRRRLDEIDFGNIPKPSLHVAPGESGGEILTDSNDQVNDQKGFLFLPIHILHSGFTLDELQTLRSGEDKDRARKEGLIAAKVAADPAIRRDVELTRRLAHTLQHFTKISIPDEQDKPSDYLKFYPPQIYIITKSGLLRIFNDKEEPPSKYYGNQFSPITFFPSRPYFWSALKGKKHASLYKKGKGADNADFVPGPGQTLGDFFYVSRPYMDLGGNGIVITLSRGIAIDGETEAVVCFDLPFQSKHGIKETLKGNMDKFQGAENNVEVKCDVTRQGYVACDSLEPKASDLNATQVSLKNGLEDYIRNKNAANELADIFGNIQVINQQPGGDIRISVPVAPATYTSASRTVTLLLINLNLIEYRKNTSLLGIGAVTALGLATVLIAYLWGSINRHRREYQAALERVARVMYRSPTPYVRLDAEDRIRDLNLSFCTLLGYPPDKESEEAIKGRTFQSLCADERSTEEYLSVQERRKKKDEDEVEVKPYTLNIKRRNGSVLQVEVVGAAVPSAEPSILPETFGILLAPEESARGGSQGRQAEGDRSNVFPIRPIA